MLVKYIMNVFKKLFEGRKLNCNEVVKETSTGKYKKLDTYLDEVNNKNALYIVDNPTSNIEVSEITTILSTDIVVNSGTIYMMGSLYILHNGGTPMFQFFVDDVIQSSFYVSASGLSYTFGTIAKNLSKGNHNIKIKVQSGNSTGVVVPGYTARNLVVIEI